MELSVDKASYTSQGLSLPSYSIRNKPSRRVNASAVFDTGAQLNMTSPATVNKLGYSMTDLFKVGTNVNSASNVKIHIIGGILLQVKATNRETGVTLKSKQLFYVSEQVTETYLSLDCCIQLQTIPPDFPAVGSCGPTSSQPSADTRATDFPAPPSHVLGGGQLCDRLPAWSVTQDQVVVTKCEMTLEIFQ